MTSQDLSYLRFSLEETVQFTAGKEVGELYSISLDPQIQTEEDVEFVRMHGFLELSGEYAPAEQREEQQSNTHTYKYVQQVLERGDGECEFFHHFPIDITIPKSRISKMEDVEIYIDSFDYEFPEKSNLKLVVDLSISGVAEEKAEAKRAPDTKVEASEKVKKEENDPAEKVEAEFSILKLDVSEEEILEEEADFSVEVKRQPDTSEKEVESQLVQAIEKRKEKQVTESSGVRSDKGSQGAPSTETNESPNVTESPSVEPIEANESPNAAESPSVESIEANESPDVTESPSQEPEVKEQKKKKAFGLKKTESMTLTDFFARKEPEEMVTWKICFVQKDDTLQKIAERYELPVTDLVRENKLETNQSIEEGQVLYIPPSR
ncbi:stage VI sporulation protein D [Bacillus sp. B190/17]|uniref:Stage VI sporulation protein D n=1 Tax=Bacillus lumedeiriae TaxID=3058829 RepID=A0ABW8I4X1_9BACI